MAYKNLNDTLYAMSSENRAEQQVKESHEWARHYDQMVWLSTSIFLLVIAQLVLAISPSKPNIETALLGILITGCLLYFVASFRKHKHCQMQLIRDMTKPELPQWPIFVMLIYGIGLYWLYHLHCCIHETILAFIYLWLIWTILVVALGHAGKYKNGET